MFSEVSPILIRQSRAAELDMTSSNTYKASVRCLDTHTDQRVHLLSWWKRGCNIVIWHTLCASSDADVYFSWGYSIGNYGNSLKTTAALPVHGGQSAFLGNTGM